MLRLATFVASVALLAACGSTSPGSSSSPSGQGGSPAGPPSGSIFPVTVTRVGGLAGFNDRIIVEASGATTVTGKAGATTTCALKGAALDSLTQTVRTLMAAPPGSPSSTGRVSDEMTITVESPLSTGPISLGEAQRSDAKAIDDLIADVTGADPAYTLCTKT